VPPSQKIIFKKPMDQQSIQKKYTEEGI
jgi:hypothetical protein